MGGLRKEAFDLRRLDDLTCVHDRHPIGDVGDHSKVVGDEEDRGSEPAPDLAKEVQDLCLNGGVEGGCGLVGDYQAGLAGKRHRDHRALAHPA